MVWWEKIEVTVSFPDFRALNFRSGMMMGAIELIRLHGTFCLLKIVS